MVRGALARGAPRPPGALAGAPPAPRPPQLACASAPRPGRRRRRRGWRRLKIPARPSQDYADLGGPCYWSEGLIGLLQLPRSELERYHDVHQRLKQVGLLGPECPSPIPGCLALVDAAAFSDEPAPSLDAWGAAGERAAPAELRLKLVAKMHADPASGSRSAIFQDGSWAPMESISNAVLETLPAKARAAVLHEYSASLGATAMPVLYTYAQVRRRRRLRCRLAAPPPRRALRATRARAARRSWPPARGAASMRCARARTQRRPRGRGPLWRRPSLPRALPCLDPSKDPHNPAPHNPSLLHPPQVLKSVDRLLLVKDLLPFAEQLEALPPGDLSQLEPVVQLKQQVRSGAERRSAVARGSSIVRAAPLGQERRSRRGVQSPAAACRRGVRPGPGGRGCRSSRCSCASSRRGGSGCSTRAAPLRHGWQLAGRRPRSPRLTQPPRCCPPCCPRRCSSGWCAASTRTLPPPSCSTSTARRRCRRPAARPPSGRPPAATATRPAPPRRRRPAAAPPPRTARRARGTGTFRAL
jgi:hypothetical protein